MSYFKAILSVLAALFIAECFPGPWSPFHGISQEKATGLAAVAGGLVESALSPSFWLLAILLFALFFLAGRLSNMALRICFFWIPAVTASLFCVASVTILTFLFFHYRHVLRN
jgi:hypothetical protein